MEVVAREKAWRVFGNVDRRPSDGTVKSEYPAWYFPVQKEQLERFVRETESQIERGIIPPEAMPRTRGVLEQNKRRLDAINEQTPKLSPIEKDALVKLMKEISPRIKESNFKQCEIDKGRADAHEEARRISEYVISLKSSEEKDWADQCNARTIEGKVRRSDFERMYKIGAKLIGNLDDFPTDIEYLRRP